MTAPVHIAYLVTHPIQYQVPLLCRLSEQPKIQLKAFFLSDLSTKGYHDPGFDLRLRWDIPLLKGYPYSFLPALGATDKRTFFKPYTYGIVKQLKADNIDILLLPGYGHQAYLRAIIAAKFLGIKILLFGDSHLLSLKRSWIKRVCKTLVYPFFLQAIDAFLAVGSWNKMYYRYYGVSDEKIFLMPFAVDNEYFRGKVHEAHASKENLRTKLNLKPGLPVILFASKFLSRKRPADLLEAYVRLSPDGTSEPNAYLLFIGDGEEREKLEQRAENLGWSNVRFLGFKNQSELPRYYDLCDVFVLPSEHEPWGLVVNEVMNAGKAIIVSDQVGCGPDLVCDGENGFVVPVGNIDALADRLSRLIDNPGMTAAMGEKSLRRISSWSYDEALDGILQAIDYVTVNQ